MKIQIKPICIDNTKCCSCGDRLADPKNETINFLYRITKIDKYQYNYKYITADVHTMNCRICNKRLTFLNNLSFILVILLAISIFLLFAISHNWDAFMTWIIGLGLSLTTLFTVGFISAYLHDDLFKSIFKKNYEDNVLTYLRSKGWQEVKPVNGQKSHNETYIIFKDEEIELLSTAIRKKYNYTIEISNKCDFDDYCNDHKKEKTTK